MVERMDVLPVVLTGAPAEPDFDFDRMGAMMWLRSNITLADVYNRIKRRHGVWLEGGKNQVRFFPCGVEPAICGDGHRLS
jgi:hypothetical protein